MAKAHKNADFVLGDGCREPSSAHWSSALPATSPAGCIWQQCARQQIAATYHATCRRACHRRAYYREQAATQPAAKTYLPLILPCIPPRNYRRATYRRVLLPGNYRRYAYHRAYYRAMGPAPSGRVIRM